MLSTSLLRLGVMSIVVCSINPALAQTPSPRTVTVSNGSFVLNGRPTQIISGELHYPRIPRAYWLDRLEKAKAMGLNTITTYAFWNVHEPQPGVYDFADQNDIAEFIREAGAVGLNVILRPGPYVCAEWELGGYPAWLLKDRTLTLRSSDPKYTVAVDRWLKRLGEEVRPLLAQNGGPIIAIQLENEYGAFGNDKAYLEQLRASYKTAGLADGVLFTSNQAGDLEKGSLPDLPSVVNFGSGGAGQAVAQLERSRPNGLRMVGEYWAGWFDKWGEEHHETDGVKEAEELKWLLQRGYSVSLYMFHGGTSFGWMNGADSHTGSDYHPDVTSYDYDAPLDESGNPSYKYALFQRAIAEATHTTPPPIPRQLPHSALPISRPLKTASLWRNLPTPVRAKTTQTFEELGQAYGYVLYRTFLDEGDGGELKVPVLHDFAQVYVDQEFVGTIDRRKGEASVALPRQTRASTLDILVENTGRVNYSHAIRTEQTGIGGEVTLGGKSFSDWEMFNLPMSTLSDIRWTASPCSGPCFYEFSMNTRRAADTYLSTQGLFKGQVWLGDHNLGRFWSVGPQQSLYAPAVWMSGAHTPVRLFDLQGAVGESITSVAQRGYGSVTHEREKQ